MWAQYLILAIAASAIAQQNDDGNLTGLIASVFGNGTGTGQPGTGTNTGTGQPGTGANIGTGQPGTGTNTGTGVGPAGGGNQNDGSCECVPYYRCQNNTIITNGVGLIDIRSNFDNVPTTVRVTLRSTCENYLEFCCEPPNLTKDKIVPPVKPRKGCGQRNQNGVGFRITGGVNGEAQFGEFPWMVAVLREETITDNAMKLLVYQCGGALIHSKVVLTAAHCVNGKQPSQLTIRAGEWDTQTKNEVYAHQDRAVEKIIIHERFHSGALYNDLALLILKTPVTLEENVDVVCLPELNEVFDGSRCFASGWGKDIFGKEGHYQVILKRVDLPVVPFNTCQESLRKTRLGNYFILDKSFICAGGEAGKDTCKGDGGSPLVCPLKSDPTRYAQAGIVAWGIGCGQDGTPGVYTNVAQLRQWVDEQMVFNNLDINVYKP